MSDVWPFFDFSQIILSEDMHVNCNSIEKHCPVFFSSICVSYSKNNVCKRTVFPKLELRRRNVICKPLTWRESVVDFFVYVMKNTVICIRYFLNTKHKSTKKILDNVFQSNCSSHAYLLTNLRKIEKRPKIRHRLAISSVLQL